MKYFILILISLNISLALAHECLDFFAQKPALSESEIDGIIDDLFNLRVDIHKSDRQTAQILNTLYTGKVKELAPFISEAEIKERIRNKAKESPTEIKAPEHKIDPAIKAEFTKMIELTAEAENFLKKMGLDIKNSLPSVIYMGKLDIVPTLISLGADINGKDSLDKSALHRAVDGGHKGIIKLLIEKGAQVNSIDVDGYTALHKSVISGQIDIAELLLANKADPNIADTEGNTPLHRAATYKNRPLVELLLKNKAKINAKNTFGDTPLALARNNDNKEMIRILKQNGGKE